MALRIAHLSDIHVGAPLAARPWLYANKRLTGLLNLHLRRRNAFSRETLDATLADCRARRVDHIVVTGDLTNVSLAAEFDAARDVFARNGWSPDDVTVVPGNHDVYLASSQRNRDVERHFASFMTDCERAVAALTRGGGPGVTKDDCGVFPFVRMPKGRAVIVGLNSAVPMPPFVARGHISAGQLAAAERILADLAAVVAPTVPRIVLVHHHPLPRLGAKEASHRLENARELARLCRRMHVDVVLHGHTHRPFQGLLGAGAPNTFVVEAGSTTYADQARYNIYDIGATPPTTDEHDALADGPCAWTTPDGRAVLAHAHVRHHNGNGSFASVPLRAPQEL